MKYLPFHTGKVAIGSAYQPTVKPHHDADALKLQAALTNKREPLFDTDGVFIILGCTAALAVMFLFAWSQI